MNQIKEYSSFDEAYKDIAYDLLNNSHLSNGTKEINNYSFKLTNLDNNVLTIVPVNYSYLCGELLWYAKGDESIEFINKFHSTGMNRTSETKWANSAYGNIIFSRHGYNQYQQVIDTLIKNQSSRRAIINLNVPDRHRAEIKDEICTIALQFYVNDGKLDCTGIMRSNDAYGCLPYDLAFFTELQKSIARKVGVDVGSYTHFAVSFHSYERDWNKLEKALTTKKSQQVSVDFDKLMVNKPILWEVLSDKDCSLDEEGIIELFKSANVIKFEKVC